MILLQIGYPENLPSQKHMFSSGTIILICLGAFAINSLLNYLIIRWAVQDALKKTNSQLEIMNQKIGQFLNSLEAKQKS